jgi:hypothetical protein
VEGYRNLPRPREEISKIDESSGPFHYKAGKYIAIVFKIFVKKVEKK